MSERVETATAPTGAGTDVGPWIRWGLPGAALVFFLATVPGYGWFRDELYYLACARHLDFGYVDHPPLVALLTAAMRALFGESLLAIRLLPSVAGALTVWVVGELAATLGGGAAARLLAQLAVVVAPVYLSLFSILSMNSYDVLFWALAWWLVARLLTGADERLWLAFGALCGVALENKIDILFLGFGLVVGLLLARRFEVFRSRWLWLGGALAALLFVPHLLWQWAHGWPTLEFMDRARRMKNTVLSPGDFLGGVALEAGIAAAVAVCGLGFLLFARRLRAARALGWAYLAILVVMTLSHAKPYYMAPAQSVVFAAGAVALEAWSAGRARWVLRPALAALLVLGGALLAPFAKPLLSEDAFVRYAAALDLHGPQEERHELGRLPQFFADMHGWPELAEQVAAVYRTLSPADQAKACVFGSNYGEAGAIDHFGPALGLPPAISNHNSYWLWGPGRCTGEVLLVIGGERERLAERFADVELGATFNCRDCMPYENGKPIWIARGLRRPIAEVWPQIKEFI
jgi:hypothetical protein